MHIRPALPPSGQNLVDIGTPHLHELDRTRGDININSTNLNVQAALNNNSTCSYPLLSSRQNLSEQHSQFIMLAHKPFAMGGDQFVSMPSLALHQLGTNMYKNGNENNDAAASWNWNFFERCPRSI